MKAKWQWGLISLLILISLKYLDPMTFTPQSSSTLIPATVTRVIDGDTLDVTVKRTAMRIRLIGVDTPELNQKGYAEAKVFLTQITPVGSLVYLESDVNDTDPYGRYLRYVWLTPDPTDFDTSSLNGLLLSKKLGKPLWINGDVKYR
jgi:micrococcal nuclease